MEKLAKMFAAQSDSGGGGTWRHWGAGESVGHKRIVLFGENWTVAAVRLTVSARISDKLAPVVANFAAFAPCRSG